MDQRCFFQVHTDIHYIKEDISLVERHRVDLYRARDRHMVKIQMHSGELTGSKSWASSIIEKDNSALMYASGKAHLGVPTGNLPYMNMNMDGKSQGSSLGTQRKEASSGLSSQHTSQSNLSVTRKKRVHSQVRFCYTL